MIARQFGMIGIAALAITSGAADADESSSDSPIVLVYLWSEVMRTDCSRLKIPVSVVRLRLESRRCCALPPRSY